VIGRNLQCCSFAIHLNNQAVRAFCKGVEGLRQYPCVGPVYKSPSQASGKLRFLDIDNLLCGAGLAAWELLEWRVFSFADLT
jgi:hypothetical protein